jgi:hypothetical protein
MGRCGEKSEGGIDVSSEEKPNEFAPWETRERMLFEVTLPHGESNGVHESFRCRHCLAQAWLNAAVTSARDQIRVITEGVEEIGLGDGVLNGIDLLALEYYATHLTIAVVAYRRAREAVK